MNETKVDHWRARLRANAELWEARMQARIAEQEAAKAERQREADAIAGEQLGIALMLMGVISQDDPVPETGRYEVDNFVFRLDPRSREHTATSEVYDFTLRVAVAHPSGWDDDQDFRTELEDWRYDSFGEAHPRNMLPNLWQHVKVYHHTKRQSDWLAEKAALATALDEAEQAHEQFLNLVAERAARQALAHVEETEKAVAADAGETMPDPVSPPLWPCFVPLDMAYPTRVTERIIDLRGMGGEITHVFRDGEGNPWVIMDKAKKSEVEL